MSSVRVELECHKFSPGPRSATEGILDQNGVLGGYIWIDEFIFIFSTI